MLELSEGELGRQEFETDRFVANFGFEAIEGGLEELVVIEGQLRNFGDGEPFGFRGIRSGAGAVS